MKTVEDIAGNDLTYKQCHDLSFLLGWLEKEGFNAVYFDFCGEDGCYLDAFNFDSEKHIEIRAKDAKTPLEAVRKAIEQIGNSKDV